MGILQTIWNGICDFLENVVDFICVVINGILNFFKEVRDWFRKKHLKRGTHTPFLGDKRKLKEMLDNAPERHVGGIFDNENKEGIIEGVYDQELDEVTDIRVVEADELDAQTKEVLGNDALVVLS